MSRNNVSTSAPASGLVYQDKLPSRLSLSNVLRSMLR